MLKLIIIAAVVIGIVILIIKRTRAPKDPTKPGGADEPTKDGKGRIDKENGN